MCLSVSAHPASAPLSGNRVPFSSEEIPLFCSCDQAWLLQGSHPLGAGSGLGIAHRQRQEGPGRDEFRLLGQLTQEDGAWGAGGHMAPMGRAS